MVEPALELEEEAPAALPEEEKIWVASQWQLMWWRFRRNKMALVSIVVLIGIYMMAVFCEFIAPYDPYIYNTQLILAPPQRIHIFRQGKLVRPFVYGLTSEYNSQTFRRDYGPDYDKVYLIHFFIRGDPYRFWGIWETDVHLFGVEEGGYLLLFGRDEMGRDLLSRVLYGARVSTSIGLIGVFVTFVLGTLIGGFSGLYGGVFDLVTQRLIEFIRSVPTLPLWMALSIALPPQWPSLRIYFGITVILSLLAWPDLARVVRSKFLSLRDEDFVVAARLTGASDFRVVTRHMLPSFISYVIASVTLAVPGMILGETSLSFLGLGLVPPMISWGVLLSQAQNIRTVALAPWLFIPGAFVVVTVLAFNFVGDGLRDAADPYSR